MRSINIGYGSFLFLATSFCLAGSPTIENTSSTSHCQLDVRGFFGLGGNDQETEADNKNNPDTSIFSANPQKVGKEPEELSEYGKQFEPGSKAAKLFEAMPPGGFSKISFCVEQIALRTHALKMIAARQDDMVNQLMKNDKDILFIGTAAKNFDSLNQALTHYHATNNKTNSTTLQLIYTDVMVAKHFVEEIVFYGEFLIATIPNILQLELDEFNRGIKGFNRDLNQLMQSPLDLFNGNFKESFKKIKDNILEIFKSKKKKFKENLESILENTKTILENTAETSVSVTKLLDTFLKNFKYHVLELDAQQVQKEATKILSGLVSKSKK